ncbi:peptide chain release factor PrfB1, chloroplastic, partial [Tanacetum coccineum]
MCASTEFNLSNENEFLNAGMQASLSQSGHANVYQHTSFSGVEVMPLLPEDSLNVEIPEEDLQIGFLRASGSGGQNVNKVETTVRITHILSGVT